MMAHFPCSLDQSSSYLKSFMNYNYHKLSMLIYLFCIVHNVVIKKFKKSLEIS